MLTVRRPAHDGVEAWMIDGDSLTSRSYGHYEDVRRALFAIARVVISDVSTIGRKENLAVAIFRTHRLYYSQFAILYSNKSNLRSPVCARQANGKPFSIR